MSSPSSLANLAHRFFAILALCLMALSGASCKKNTGANAEWEGGDPGLYGDYDGSVGAPPLGNRDERYSLYGPGSANVDKSMFSPVFFAFDSADISESEMGKVQQVAGYLSGGSRAVILGGHTDSIGTSEYNRNLGERRAQSVRSALIQMGVNPGSIQTVSYGEDMPAGSSHDANRRVEIGIIR